jgi:hypothetical protein
VACSGALGELELERFCQHDCQFYRPNRIVRAARTRSLVTVESRWDRGKYLCQSDYRQYCYQNRGGFIALSILWFAMTANRWPERRKSSSCGERSGVKDQGEDIGSANSQVSRVRAEYCLSQPVARLRHWSCRKVCRHQETRRVLLPGRCANRRRSRVSTPGGPGRRTDRSFPEKSQGFLDQRRR